MSSYYEPFWGVHMMWWAFWIIAMVTVFGFNVPERVRINSLDPNLILRRRLAKGQIAEEEFKRIHEHLRSLDDSVKRNSVARISNISSTGHPVVDGLSLSAAWAILYSICTVFYWIAPQAMVAATSKLFHGMSFTQMSQAGSPFGFTDFVSVLTLGAVYTFSAGSVWSLVRSKFLRRGAERRLDSLDHQSPQRTRLSA